MVQTTNAPGSAQDLATVKALFAVVRYSHVLSPREYADLGALKLVVAAVELGPVRLSDLAEEARLDTSTASRHVSTLEAQKMLRRLPDPNDRRAQMIEATPKAEKYLNELLAQRARAIGPALAGWDIDDRAKLDELLERLAADMGAEISRQRLGRNEKKGNR